MANRNLLLPAPPDERTCELCPLATDHHCRAFARRLLEANIPTLSGIPSEPRLPECLSAEAAARSQATELTRLRRVEARAREYIATDDRLGKLVSTSDIGDNLDDAFGSAGAALIRLRAALEER